MLVDILEKVLLALEGGQNEQLRELGASDGSISLVCAFLEERRMTITIDGEKAKVPYAMKQGGSML